MPNGKNGTLMHLDPSKMDDLPLYPVGVCWSNEKNIF
jgi:hypothetical protein